MTLFANVNQNVRVYSDHSACFRNASNITLQYGYRFTLQVLNDYVEDAETFMMGPGQEVCYSQNDFMNYQSGAPGKYQIIAITKGAEGNGTTDEVRDYATLTVS